MWSIFGGPVSGLPHLPLSLASLVCERAQTVRVLGPAQTGCYQLLGAHPTHLFSSVVQGHPPLWHGISHSGVTCSTDGGTCCDQGFFILESLLFLIYPHTTGRGCPDPDHCCLLQGLHVPGTELSKHFTGIISLFGIFASLSLSMGCILSS